MGKLSYSPSTLRKIDKVCKEASFIILNYLKEDINDLLIDDIESALKSVYSFYQDNFHEIGELQYLIEVEFTEEGESPLDAKTVLEAIRNNFNVISCDVKLNVLNDSESIKSLGQVDISRYSQKSKGIVFFCANGIDTVLYCKGMAIQELNVNNPHAGAPVPNRYHRSAKDYRISLTDFYKQEVRTNRLKHWKDKRKRLLIAGRKTEDIFQNGLYGWLLQNLANCTVKQKVSKISNDETDIEIIEHGGNCYLIEIKWLGKNAANTEYKTDKIIDAIDQVKNYLEIDPLTVDATLVVYDARAQKEFDQISSDEGELGNYKIIREFEEHKFPEKGLGHIYFLISESASKRTAS